MNIAEFRDQFPDINRTDQQWENVLNALTNHKQPRQPLDTNMRQRQKIQHLLNAQRAIDEKQKLTDRGLGIVVRWSWTVWARYVASFALGVAIVLIWDARWSILWTSWSVSYSQSHDTDRWVHEVEQLYTLMAYGVSADWSATTRTQSSPITLHVSEKKDISEPVPQRATMTILTQPSDTWQTQTPHHQQSTQPTRDHKFLTSFPASGQTLISRPLIPPTITSFLHPQWTRLARQESGRQYEFDFLGNLTANAHNDEQWVWWPTYDFLVEKRMISLSGQEATTYEGIPLRWEGGVPYQRQTVRDEQGNMRFFTTYLQTFEQTADYVYIPSQERINQAINSISRSCPSLTGEFVYSTNNWSHFIPAIRLWCNTEPAHTTFLIIPYEN